MPKPKRNPTDVLTSNELATELRELLDHIGSVADMYRKAGRTVDADSISAVYQRLEDHVIPW